MMPVVLDAKVIIAPWVHHARLSALRKHSGSLLLPRRK